MKKIHYQAFKLFCQLFILNSLKKMQLQSRKHVRHRGVILTDIGSRKLNHAKAKVEIEQNFKRYTLEALSEETGLTPTTLSKVFIGSVGVDKRTLQCCFNAFNLTLTRSDYFYQLSHQDNLTETGSMLPDETCSSIELAEERRNTTQIHKMNQPLDNRPPRPPTAPGGQMPLESVFYIDRLIKESLCYEAIDQPGALLNIRAPKQLGKTSLMTRILAHANSLGYHTVSISLQLADAEILQNLERFLQWFCARVSYELNLQYKLADFGNNSYSSKANANDYFENVLLAKLDRPLVIAIDELNQLFAYPDIASEFLLLLRTWSEQAKARVADSNCWYLLRLVTVYSTEILMPPSIDPSLLNTGLVIELPEFTPTQVQALAYRYEQEMTALQQERLMALLGGHPYRLQLAFYHLQQQTITLEELLENSALTTAIYAVHLQQQWWNLQRYPELWTVFTQILSQSNLVDCEVYLASQLQLMGLVQLHGITASLACELFRPFFRARLRQICTADGTDF